MLPVVFGLIVAALAQRTPPKSIEIGSYFEVKLASVVRDVEDRVERFAKWKKKLVTRDDILGGETVFPNSRLAVRQVGEMVRRGAFVKEIGYRHGSSTSRAARRRREQPDLGDRVVRRHDPPVLDEPRPAPGGREQINPVADLPVNFAWAARLCPAVDIVLRISGLYVLDCP